MDTAKPLIIYGFLLGMLFYNCKPKNEPCVCPSKEWIITNESDSAITITELLIDPKLNFEAALPPVRSITITGDFGLDVKTSKREERIETEDNEQSYSITYTQQFNACLTNYCSKYAGICGDSAKQQAIWVQYSACVDDIIKRENDQDDKKGPVLEIVPVVNLGNVDRGEKMIFSIPIANIGDSQLDIKNIIFSPKIQNTRISDKTFSLLPAQTFEIEFSIPSTNKSRIFEESVILQTNLTPSTVEVPLRAIIETIYRELDCDLVPDVEISYLDDRKIPRSFKSDENGQIRILIPTTSLDKSFQITFGRKGFEDSRYPIQMGMNSCASLSHFVRTMNPIQ